MQLYLIFPGEYVQGTLFPQVPNTLDTRKQDSNWTEDWSDCTFFNH